VADEMMDERFIGNDSVFVVSLALPPHRRSEKNDVRGSDRSIEFIAMLLGLSACSASVLSEETRAVARVFLN